VGVAVGRVWCVRAPGLISVRDPRFGVGDVMGNGVSFPRGRGRSGLHRQRARDRRQRRVSPRRHVRPVICPYPRRTPPFGRASERGQVSASDARHGRRAGDSRGAAGTPAITHGSKSAATTPRFKWAPQASPTATALAQPQPQPHRLITRRSGGHAGDTVVSAPRAHHEQAPNCTALRARLAECIRVSSRVKKAVICRLLRCRRRDSSPRHADYDSAAP
jgi:hypothetical protein